VIFEDVFVRTNIVIFEDVFVRTNIVIFEDVFVGTNIVIFEDVFMSQIFFCRESQVCYRLVDSSCTSNKFTPF